MITVINLESSEQNNFDDHLLNESYCVKLRISLLESVVTKFYLTGTRVCKEKEEEERFRTS